MPLEPFKFSEPLTLGVELELQLVSLSDFDLTAASPDMLDLLARKPFPGNVTPEITESMIEISTDVQTRHIELLAQPHSIRDTLVRAGDTLNVGVCGGGMHPFQSAVTCWNGKRRRLSRTITSSTTTTDSRPAASDSTARWCIPRATKPCRSAKTC